MCVGLVARLAHGPPCGDRLGTSGTCRTILHPPTGPSGGAQECDGEDRGRKAYFGGNGCVLVVLSLSQEFGMRLQSVVFTNF